MSVAGNEPQRPQLGLFDAISIIVGIVIGATIFKAPGVIFNFTSDPWTALAVWLLGGILALVGALCYAELATAYPRSGGDYVYLTRSFGPWCGFLFGWAQLTVVLTASIAAMAYVFAEFATHVYPLDNWLNDNGLSSELQYTVVAVSVLSLVNILGVQLGKLAQNLLTLAKIVGVIGIIVAGFGWSTSPPGEWVLAEPGKLGWGPLALILVLYAYGGWNDAAFVASEVRNPARNIPRALLIGVGLIAVVYVLVNAAYLTSLGFDGVKQGQAADGSRLPPIPARVLEHALGAEAGLAMSIIVMICALGAVNGLIFTGARVYATLGNEHRLFGFLGWNPGRGSPVLAIVIQGLIALGMIYLFGTEAGYHQGNAWLAQIGVPPPKDPWKAGDAFEHLLSHTAPVFWTFFLMTGFSLFILRGVDPGLPRPFRVPFYPLLPFVFCLMCFYMQYQSIDYVKWRALIAAGMTLVGLPLFALDWLLGRPTSATPLKTPRVETAHALASERP